MNYVYGITIKADGKAQVVAEFNGVEKALTNLAATAADTSKQTNAAGNAASNLSSELKALLSRIDPVQRATYAFNEAQAILSRGLQAGSITSTQFLRSLELARKEQITAVESSIKLARASTQITQEFESAKTETLALTGSIKTLAASLVAGFGLNELLRTINEYTKFTSQLKLATSSQEEYAASYENTIRIAKTAQTEIGAVGVLYARTANALKQLGATQNQIAAITETVALSLKVSGATAEESASAMLQLSQAFGSGVLRGEEFNAVNEAAPALMRALADGIGVPVGALRNMASQGQLTADVIANAFKNPVLIASLRDQAKEVQTISSAYVELKNTLTIAIGEFDKATGASKAIASAISAVGRNLDIVIPLLGGLAAGLIALSGPAVLTGLAALGGAIVALGAPVVGIIAGVTALGIAYAKLSADGRTELQKLIDKETELRMAKTQLAEVSSKPTGVIEAEKNQRNYAEAVAEVTRRTRELYDLQQTIKFNESSLAFVTPAKILAEKQKEKELMTGLNVAIEQQNKLRKISAEGLPKETALVQNQTGSYDDLAKALGLVTYKVNQYVKQQQEAIALLNTGAITYKQYQEVIETTSANIQKLYDNQNKQTKAEKEADSARKKAQEEQQRADEAYTKARLKYTDDLLKANMSAVESINKNIEATQAEIDNYGKLPTEITAATIAKLEMAKADALIFQDKIAVQGIEAQIEAYKRLAAVQSNKETVEAQRKNMDLATERTRQAEKEREELAKETNRKQEQDYKETMDSLNNIFRKGFASMLNKGGDDFKSWTKSLTTTFKTAVADAMYKMLAQPFVASIVTSVTGQLDMASYLVPKTSDGKSSTSALGSITDIFSKGNDAVVSAIEKLGFKLYDGSGGVMSNIGEFLGANAQSITNVLPYAAAGIQALTGDIQGAAFTAAGAAIGSFIPGVGTAIGAAVGGLLGSVFSGGERGKGDRSQSTYSNGVFVNNAQFSGDKGGSLGAGDSLTSLSNVFATTLGDYLGKFGINPTITTDLSYGSKKGNSHGDLSGTIDGAVFASYVNGDFNAVVENVLSVGIVRALQASSLSTDLKSLFDGLSDRTSVNNMLTATLNLKNAQDALASSFNLTVDEAAKVAKTQSDVAGALAQLTDAANAGLNVGQQILAARDAILSATQLDILPTTLAGFDNILKGIDKSTTEGAQRFADLFSQRSNFVSLTNTTDSLKNNVTSALYDVVSADQKKKIAQDAVNNVFSVADVAVPTSMEALIKLADTIDYTTTSGLNLAAAFPTLVSAFKTLEDASNTAADSLNMSADKFTSLVDFNQYRAIANNYGTTAAKAYLKVPSFDVGTNNVPYDMLALVHADERIVPKADNKAMIDALNGAADIVLLQQTIENLRQDLRDGQAGMIKPLKEMSSKLDKWDKRGLPGYDPDKNQDAVLKVQVA